MLRGALLATCTVAFASLATAQTAFPTQPVKIVVPFNPGGTTDFLARMIGPIMSKELGQPVVVENRSGANSIIGTNAAAKAKPDGYTLVVGTSAMSLNSGFSRKGLAPELPYDTSKDLAGVAIFGVTPYLLLTNAELPIKSVNDLVALGKASPGAVAYGSAGTGGSPHLGGILLGLATGTDFLHVPYKGSGPALIALLGKQVQFTYASYTSAKPLVDAGKLRVLAVAAPERVPFLPDVPTIAEQGIKGAEVDSWFGLLVPAATPINVRERLGSAINTALADPEIAKRLADIGAVRPKMTVQQFDDFYQKDVKQWETFIGDFKGSLD